MKWGKRLAVITLLVMFFLIGRDADTVGNIGGALCMLQLVSLIYVIVPTEQALKKHFDAKGNRRKPKVE